MSPNWDWNIVFILTAIAMVGGSLGYAARAHDSKEKFKLIIFVQEGAYSGFFGFLLGVINVEQGVPLGIGGAFIGVLSWSGSRTMLKYLKRKAGSETDKQGNGG